MRLLLPTLRENYGVQKAATTKRQDWQNSRHQVWGARGKRRWSQVFHRLDGIMQSQECGRRYFSNPGPSGLTSRTVSDHVPLALRHSHTFEMSKACSVDPRGEPGYSDWPARHSLARHDGFCRSGCVSLAHYTHGTHTGGIPLTPACLGTLGASHRSGWEADYHNGGTARRSNSTTPTLWNTTPLWRGQRRRPAFWLRGHMRLPCL